MARAVCKSCGRNEWWRAYSGTRMADLRCSACGGELQGPTAGRTGGGNTGRKAATCVLCNRRRFKLAVMTKPWAPRWWRNRFSHRLPWDANGPVPVRGPAEPYPAGAACCWLHEPTPAAPTDHRFEEPGTILAAEIGADSCAFCARPRAEHATIPAATP